MPPIYLCPVCEETIDQTKPHMRTFAGVRFHEKCWLALPIGYRPGAYSAVVASLVNVKRSSAPDDVLSP